jgi:hypothetical protein
MMAVALTGALDQGTRRRVKSSDEARDIIVLDIAPSRLSSTSGGLGRALGPLPWACRLWIDSGG